MIPAVRFRLPAVALCLAVALVAGGCRPTGSPPTAASGRVVTVAPGSNDTAAIQRAVDSLGTRGGTVRLAAGSYTVTSPIRLSPGNTAPLILSGYGATIHLTAATPRFLVWDRTVKYQTFRHFIVEGFAVDAGGRHPAQGSYSVLGFDMRAGGLWDAAYLNIEDVTIRDCRVYNVATSPTGAWNPCDINVFTAQFRPAEAIWDHIDDVLVQNCTCIGGSRGIGIWAGGPGSLSVSLDRVAIRDCRHDTMTTFTASSSSSNFQIGQSGRVGSAQVIDCQGDRSGDVGVEMDNASDGLVADCTIDNPFWTGYFYTNFRTPSRLPGTIAFDHDVTDVRVASVGGGSQNGLSVSATGSIPMGTIIVRDGVYKVTAPVTKPRYALFIDTNVTMAALDVDRLTVTHTTSISAADFFYVQPKRGKVDVAGIVVDGVRLH